MFLILSIIILFIISISSFGFLKGRIEILSIEMKNQKNRLSVVEEDFAILNEKVNHLMFVSNSYQKVTDNLFNRFGYTNLSYSKDLSFFESSNDISTFTKYLEDSIEPLEQIRGVIELNKDMINDIPSSWPVKGGLGYITMYFGLNEHPFTGFRYLHSGIDVSVNGRSGDFVVSTANGTVIEIGYSLSYGNFIIVKHGFDFHTRYAHLQKINVYKGQKVERGEIIGLLGNTGLSTGPHIHYEIYIGSKHIDPIKYMILKN